jgi:hypothetical protein
VEEHGGESKGGGFLPPEPAGPEPELGGRPPQAPQPQAAFVGAQPGAPPPGYGYPPPPPPPGYAYPPPWSYPQQRVPDNGQAVAGFVFSLVSLGLLIISAGLSTIVSLGCAVTGIICSRNGKRKVDAGETPKHRGLAQAGFIIGWISLALSILATIGWILFFAFGITDDSVNFDPEQTRSAAARLIGA